MIAIGYRTPQESGTTPIANANAVSATQQTASTERQTAVNNVVASNVAANAAMATNLSVASVVSSTAISTQIASEMPTTDDSAIAKPQIVQVSSSNRSVTQYTVLPGDTTQSLSAKFGISADTIKWANNLTSDNLSVGKVIDILPRDGIAYTVKSGDTIQSIADKYKANASLITTYNDLEISGVAEGSKIIIPGGELPATERPGYIAPITRISNNGGGSSGGAFAGFRSGSVGNKYAYGNCTWWAYERRAQMGRPVGSFWGNGGSWAFSGRAAGFMVNNVPAAGAVLVEAGSPGHVGVVESVNADGSIVISEMNNAAYGGFNIVNNRTISAGQAASYQYVH